MNYLNLLLTLLISGQGSPDWQTREQATAALKNLLPYSLQLLEAGKGSKNPEVAVRCKTTAAEWHAWKLEEWVASHRPFPWLDMLPKSYPGRQYLIDVWVEYAQQSKDKFAKPEYSEKGTVNLANGWPYYRYACECWIKDRLHGFPADEGTLTCWDELLSAMRQHEPKWLEGWKKGTAGPLPN